MRCDEARELMHEVLDGSEVPRERLEAHLADCAECAAEFAALQRAQEAVAVAVVCDPPEDRLERAAVAALAVADERPRHTRSAWAAPAMAAAVVLAFGMGLWAGRSAWPREVLRVERVPRVVERIVEREVPVEVPVVQERVVVRRVPVVRERIVYRDRPTAPAEDQVAAAPPEPVMPEVHEIRITAEPLPVTITHSEEIIPAPVAQESAPEPETMGAEPDAPDGERLALQMSASGSERIVQ